MGTFSGMKYLGGAIAIPDTFPDLAAATYYDAIELRDNEALNRVVQIVESKPHSRVTRFVSLRDVVAVFATQETDPRKIRAAWLDPDNWSTDAKAIKRNVKGINGIVYVAEPARVLIQLEFSAPATNRDAASPWSMMASCCCCNPCCWSDRPDPSG